MYWGFSIHTCPGLVWLSLTQRGRQARKGLTFTSQQGYLFEDVFLTHLYNLSKGITLKSSGQWFLLLVFPTHSHSRSSHTNVLACTPHHQDVNAACLKAGRVCFGSILEGVHLGLGTTQPGWTDNGNANQCSVVWLGADKSFSGKAPYVW